MSYEKYIKYKIKYLNLKANIHNQRIATQNSFINNEENDFINTLGSSPNSENNNLIGGNNNNNNNVTESNLSYNLPNILTSSEELNKVSNDEVNKVSNTKLIGGNRKIKKVFSESESDSDFKSDSSLLSFSSSVISNSSSDF
jgi:hypothetical protein